MLVKELQGMLLAVLIHGTQRSFVLKVCELSNKRVLGKTLTKLYHIPCCDNGTEATERTPVGGGVDGAFLIIVVFPFNSSGQGGESEASVISEGYYVVTPTNILVLRVAT
jgi:hypothetical protein